MSRNTAQGTTSEAFLLLEGESGYEEESVELVGKAFYPADTWQRQTMVCVCVCVCVCVSVCLSVLYSWCVCVCVSVCLSVYLSYIPGQLMQFCLSFSSPMDCNPPGSSVHGILQARILERVTIPFSRGSSRSRDQTHRPTSPALQADSLPSEPPGKFCINGVRAS